jgi:phosphoglycolate phosphatase
MSGARFDAIVFDLDGTLVDSRADIATAANRALAHCGYPVLQQAQIASYVGDGARNLVARAAGLPPMGTETDALLASFLGFYAANVCEQTVLMPGAREALEALRALPLAVLTNKPSALAVQLLQQLGIASYFRCVIGGGDLPELKPSPEPLREICRRLSVSIGRVLMVGDGPQDIECGRRAGAATLGVSGGIADRAQLLAAGPDLWLDSLADLPQLVGRLGAADRPSNGSDTAF